MPPSMLLPRARSASQRHNALQSDCELAYATYGPSRSSASLVSCWFASDQASLATALSGPGSAFLLTAESRR